MCLPQISPSNAKYMPYAQITMYINGGTMPIYATIELTGIYHMTRSAVHTMMMPMIYSHAAQLPMLIWSLAKYTKKSVPSRPPHPPNVKTDKNQSFPDHHMLPRWKLLKSVLSRPPQPLKVEIFQIHSLQGHHILPK